MVHMSHIQLVLFRKVIVRKNKCDMSYTKQYQLGKRSPSGPLLLPHSFSTACLPHWWYICTCTIKCSDLGGLLAALKDGHLYIFSYAESLTYFNTFSGTTWMMRQSQH